MRVPVIETGPDEWRSSARPSSYTRDWLVWWEVDGIEPLAPKGLRLRRSDRTSLSLLALPESVSNRQRRIRR